jgi:hypothetical protein
MSTAKSVPETLMRLTEIPQVCSLKFLIRAAWSL